MAMHNQLSVFVKPWKELPLAKLGRHIRGLGFEAIELPVRPGFPCQPTTIEQDLPVAVHTLADEGVEVLSITADNKLDDERMYAACAASGVSLNRVMFRCEGQNYWEAEDAAKRQLEQAQPLCEQYHVRIGVQNHTGDFVAPNAHGLYHLLKDCDTRYVGAIWDAGHEALEGVAPEIALDVLEGFLMMVNLKSGFWQRTNGPEAEFAEWEVFWTSARAGRADWRRVVRKLETIHYDGPICLTVEYSDSAALERLAEEDLSHARTLLGV